MRTLSKYDEVLLPTYYPGEGYPGIIIEAYSVGIPVITTKWKSIPEIADDTCALFVEPRSAQALYEAMITLIQNKDLYLRLCRGAAKKQQLFDSEVWAARFAEYCNDLATKQFSR